MISLAGATLAGGLASAGTGLLSSLLGYQSTQNANSKNEKLQREQWARDDQAYQRTVADMQMAGLNPLAGVAPVNSGLSANIIPHDFSGLSKVVDSAVSSYLQARNLDIQNNLKFDELKLQAASKGLDPDKLFSSDSYSDLADLYKDSVQSRTDLTKAQKQDIDNAIDSGSNRYTSSYGKVLNDIKTEVPVVQEAIDAVNEHYDNAKKIVQTVTDPVKLGKVYYKTFKEKFDKWREKRRSKKYLKQHGQGK